MNGWLPKRMQSVFLILLAIFLAVIIPLYVLGFGIYSWGYSMTKEEITNSLNANADYYMSALESEIRRIRSLQYECLNDENLFYFVNASQIMTEFQRISALNSLQKRLSVMKNSSSYIRDVNVYLPRIGKMISAAGGVGDITDAWEPIVRAKADAAESGIIYASGGMYLCAPYPPMPYTSTATPLYVLIIELSSGDIQNRLLSFNRYPDGGTALVNRAYAFSLIGGKDGGISSRIGQGDLSAAEVAAKRAVTVKGDGGPYILVGKYSKYLNMELFSYMPEATIYGGIRRYQVLFTVFSFVALIIVIAFSISAYRLIRKPMVKLVRSLSRVEKGDLSVRIRHHANDEFGYLYGAFNNMAESLQNLIEQNYQQQILTQRAELRQLQAQINPHFLYNSFFILYRMAKDEDYENITTFLKYLADYYRFITRDVMEEVPLESEVAHARNYTEIQLMRFSQRVSASFAELPEGYRGMPVPRLILQPVIENAFEHGLKDKAEGGELRVEFVERCNMLVIRVEDNGACPDEAKLDEMRELLDQVSDSVETTGIVNIHRRLKLKFGPESGLRLSRGESGGLAVEIRLMAKGTVEDVQAVGC